MIDRYEQSNNFGALGIKSLEGKLNIGANYGDKSKLPEEAQQKLEQNLKKPRIGKALNHLNLIRNPPNKKAIHQRLRMQIQTSTARRRRIPGKLSKTLKTSVIGMTFQPSAHSCRK